MAKKTYVKTGKKSEADASVLMMKTVAGTTWRMFVPTIGFTLVGLVADYCYRTKPWLMVAGISLGFAVSFSLVWLQVAKIKQQESKND